MNLTSAVDRAQVRVAVSIDDPRAIEQVTDRIDPRYQLVAVLVPPRLYELTRVCIPAGVKCLTNSRWFWCLDVDMFLAWPDGAVLQPELEMSSPLAGVAAGRP